MWQYFTKYKQLGYDLDDYLANRGWKSVAIYGLGLDGATLYNELKNSNHVEIKYLIDRSGKSDHMSGSFHKPEMVDYNSIDVVIITVDYISTTEKLESFMLDSKCEMIGIGHLFNWMNYIDLYDQVLTYTEEHQSRLIFACYDTPLINKKNLSTYEKRTKYLRYDNQFLRTAPEYIADTFLDSGPKDQKYIRDICAINYPIEVHPQFNCNVLSDITSDYYNVINHNRFTWHAPETYDASIHFFGPCICAGYMAEDKYTVESQLQQRINHAPFNNLTYQIINHGSWGTTKDHFYRLLATKIEPNDLCIFLGLDFSGFEYHRLGHDYPVTFYNCDALFKRPHSYGEIFIDNYHMANKGYKIIADGLFELLHSNFSQELVQRESSNEDNKAIKISSFNTDNTAIKSNSLKQYVQMLESIKQDACSTIGSIVMNCNPFTKGHKHLIEEASSRVDYLYIFVVEENKSFFSFHDRFNMVMAGTSSLKNIKVIPSGKHILSSLTLPEYFDKEKDGSITIDASNDLKIFCLYIAPALGINKRFVGEEPLCQVTRQYNAFMKNILPSYGIELIEIPRKMSKGDIISATKVRQLIRANHFEELVNYVPETTIEYLRKNAKIPSSKE